MPPTEQTQIAVLSTKVEALTVAVTKLDNKLDIYGSKFVSQEQLTAALETERKRITELESSDSLWKYISPVLSSVITAAVVFLLINYLQNLPVK